MSLHDRRLCWGKFMNCGQICVAPDYILCTKVGNNKYIELGIRGAKGAPLPRLCFAQLVFVESVTK